MASRKRLGNGVVIVILVATVYISTLHVQKLIPTTPTPLRRNKTILYWNQDHGTYEWYGAGTKPFEKCPINQCYLTSSKTEMPIDEYDAIMFHLRFVKRDSMPEKRSQFQRYIFWTFESPAYDFYASTKLEDLNDLFNWTFTYRTDSDIPDPYGWCEKNRNFPHGMTAEEYRKSSVYKNSMKNVASGKSKQVAWFVSHCGAVNKRLEYVRELGRYLPVDIYGKCGNLTCEGDGCYQMVEKDYKFYIAFENSNCYDYVTEKLFNILEQNTVPIVFGGANYSKFAPPHSYINAGDFESPQKLAEYLKFLDSHDESYNEYFWWKDFYTVLQTIETKQTLCKLCEKLHTDQTTKIYSSMHEWWTKKGNCTVPNTNW